MLIGEVAAIAGVSTRTIRHYHRVGVVPEPSRRSSGYREYELPDVLALVRAVRLARRGLTLSEVRDVLHDGSGTQLHVVLDEVVADLDRQISELSARRAHLVEMRARPDVELAHLPLMPPSVAAAVRQTGDPVRALAEQSAWEAIAASVPEGDAAAVAVAIERLFSEDEHGRELLDLTERFAALGDDDPAAEAVAHRIAALSRAVDQPDVFGQARATPSPLFDAFVGTLTTGQQRCLQLVERLLA